MRRCDSLGRTLALIAMCAGGLHAGNETKVEGYAEWRKGGFLIVDGQRLRWPGTAKFKGEGAARDFASIPLGYEVKAKGVRLPDGSIMTTEVQAKPNGTALFEPDVRQATTEMESAWLHAGEVYQDEGGGAIEHVGRLHTTGPDVDRVRRIVDRLVPPYLSPSNFRVYVVDNEDWNAFACANGMIVVHSSLLRATDEDEMAIVLGHELVHATHEHSRREFKSAMWIQLIALGVAVGTEGVDSKTARAIIGLASTFTLMAVHNGYGRGCEDQADRVGLRYAYEAGYDIRKGPRLWNRFAQKYGDSPKALNFFFGDHSRSADRARTLQSEIALNYGPGQP